MVEDPLPQNSLVRPARVWGALQRRAQTWAYSGEVGRDLRIDLLRGLAVLAMVIDHLAGPSRLYLITGGNRFYTSAAEGFIFLSGLTVGLAYRHIAERQGLAAAARRLLIRASSLYVLAVGLTLIMLPVSELFSLPWASGLESTNPIQLVWAIVSLHQTYYLVDVLALYVLLMLAAPVALFLVCDGRTWLLITASWLIWVGFQFFPQQTELPWTTAGNNLFYLSAWQALFFTALAIGYHRERLGRLVSRNWQVPLLVGSACAFVAVLVLYAWQAFLLLTLQSFLEHVPGASSWTVADLEDAFFAKGYVRPGRVVASVIVFGFLFQLVTLIWTPIRRGLGWLLLPLGQNALYAYSSHVVLALLLGLAAIQLPLAAGYGLNATIQLASIGLIWLGIRFRVLYPNANNRGTWMAAVVPLAIAAGVMLRVDTQVQPALASPVPESAQSSAAIRQARAFGTPIPRAPGTNPDSHTLVSAQAAPAASIPVLPAVPAPVLDSGADVVESLAGSASQYVGRIEGTFREFTLYSPSLDRDMSYYAYLPPGYATEGRRYPVLYMLHGGGGSKDEWPAYGLVNDVDRAVVSKDIRPLIVIMPQGDFGYWVNWVNAGPRWGDYVSRDLRRQIDSTFRTLPDASHRGIGGLSMGGAGALQLAFNHPDIFQVAGSHSASLHLDDGTFSTIYGSGEDFAQREPIDLANSAPGIDSLKIWVDAGEEDPWLERDEMLHENLLQRGVAHNWSILPGGHDGDYWTQNLPAYIRFYDGMLNGDSSYD
jgi:S-formylglutathione hydrolase FrmB